MPRIDIDRDSYVRRMDRRVRWGWRVSRVRRGLGAKTQPLQAEAYDRAFRSDLDAVTYYYALRNDHLPDFEEPRWINEKIRWQFLNHDNPLMTLCADKVGVRSYLAYKGSEIRAPELYGIFASREEMMQSELPDRYILKASFGWSQNYFVDEAVLPQRQRLAASLAEWSEWDHWRVLGELHYRDIEKRWFAEEILGPVPKIREFKFYCIHGQPIFVLCITDRVNGRFRHALYDTNWRPVDFHWNGHPSSIAGATERPAAFEQMVAEAKRLSEDFMHVRVDFMECEGRVVFSELTFSGGGARNPFVPVFKNELLGEMMDLRRSAEYLERGKAVTSSLRLAPAAAA